MRYSTLLTPVRGLYRALRSSGLDRKRKGQSLAVFRSDVAFWHEAAIREMSAFAPLVGAKRKSISVVDFLSDQVAKVRARRSGAATQACSVAAGHAEHLSRPHAVASLLGGLISSVDDSRAGYPPLL